VVWRGSWPELQRVGRLLAGEVQPDGWLRIDSPGHRGGTVRVLALDQPGLSGKRYGLTGSVRYRNVRPDAYLEMWSVFGEGGRYFTRTMAPAGPLAALKGDSDARSFTLPFFLRAGDRPPQRVELNVVFSGGGTVWLGPIRLVEYAAGEDPLAVPGAWWDGRTAGWLGAIGGSLIGLFGAVLGALVGLGRARQFVLASVHTLLALGACSLTAGLLALWLGQPYAVYYPLLLFGIVLTAVFGFSVRTVRRRYEQLELQRMAAMDLDATAGGGC